MNLKQQIEEKETELLELKKRLNSESFYKRIETFEDACEDQGINPKDPKFQYQLLEIDNSGPAFERLKVIRKALLGDKELVWEVRADYKYFPRFNLSRPKGSGFCGSGFGLWHASFSCLSSRLAMNSRERAIYFGSQFEDDWYEYMVEHKIK